MFYKYVKEYFGDPQEGYKGILLMLGILLTTAGIVVLIGLFASWSVVFWDALVANNMALYMSSIQQFVLLVAAFIGGSVLKDYLAGLLTIRWRNWLTTKLINKYTSSEENNYLDLARHDLENPAQRIQGDVKAYVEQTVSLGINLFQSILTLCLFVGKLWVVGGALTIIGLTIPGYLVWVALIYSAVVTLITHFLGHSLANLNNQQRDLEADFRNNLENLSSDAESIAQDHSETYYKDSLKNNARSVTQVSYQILGIRINLTAFISFYSQISWLIPYILAAPLLFIGSINLGQLMEIGFSFSQIQSSLTWFSDSYESLAQYTTSAKRIAKLEESMREGGLETNKRDIHLQESKTDELSVHDLNIAYPSPSSTQFIMKNMNLNFKPGENTLIKGRSGLGKSTLFKVMAGAWKYGDGEVRVANSKSMCFLPQKPSLPHDTLKGVLAYPEPVNTYTDEEYVTALRDVDLQQFINSLNMKDKWSKRLSPGQQQRISFARALLKKPQWLFLDEATASLDEDNEIRMYSLVKEKLPETTFISIAHRSTVSKFHDRVVTFDVDKNTNFKFRDEHESAQQEEDFSYKGLEMLIAI